MLSLPAQVFAVQICEKAGLPWFCLVNTLRKSAFAKDSIFSKLVTFDLTTLSSSFTCPSNAWFLGRSLISSAVSALPRSEADLDICCALSKVAVTSAFRRFCCKHKNNTRKTLKDVYWFFTPAWIIFSEKPFETRRKCPIILTTLRDLLRPLLTSITAPTWHKLRGCRLQVFFCTTT